MNIAHNRIESLSNWRQQIPHLLFQKDHCNSPMLLEVQIVWVQNKCLKDRLEMTKPKDGNDFTSYVAFWQCNNPKYFPFLFLFDIRAKMECSESLVDPKLFLTWKWHKNMFLEWIQWKTNTKFALTSWANFYASCIVMTCPKTGMPHVFSVLWMVVTWEYLEAIISPPSEHWLFHQMLPFYTNFNLFLTLPLQVFVMKDNRQYFYLPCGLCSQLASLHPQGCGC